MTDSHAGVLLLNLGTPDSPTTADVRRYLAEFLWDPRVVEVPRPIWWLVLHGIILRTRPQRSAAAYAEVWTEAGSPLLEISRRQATALATALESRLGRRLPVVLAMRYGNPSIKAGLEALWSHGVRRVLVLPLYPQYSATTTASTFDAVANELRRWRHLPELRFVNGYHEDPDYIDALAASIHEFQTAHGTPRRLLLSFHGIPKRYADAGDPYPDQCHQTGALLAKRLGLADDTWTISFQSRLGREEWLRPYTDETLTAWGREGLESVQVVCPGFSADCLETLEEIAQENRATFTQAGGGDYAYIPALNDRPEHIELLAGLAARNLGGWL